ncbi:hypothetical protein PHMEG_00014673 [Phytophthora megakarya]|uniref:Bzip transcription factor n=1 Tax=Phytophthora megakarya TaxID=4795 RepID=A0A225W4S7_9STRA|nr:hypothetical protein PHMEG_00014673 [Phytophthora megakarya]
MVPEHKATPELIEALIRNDARQRQRRREIQQRYRQKFDNLAESLEHEVKKIQEQIRLRELEHERLVVRTPTSVTPWIVVSEYYRLFRNGFKVPQTPQPIITSPGTIYERNNAQMAFLHKVMAPDVSVNSGIGIEAIVQEWLAVPYVNDDITIRLLQLENDEDDAMLATIQSHIIITEDMLRCEFPYFADITIEDQKSALVNKLVGKKLSILSKVRFEWDSSSGRVLGMHYTADLVTPFLKLLGNLQDTARVLDKSLLSIANSS